MTLIIDGAVLALSATFGGVGATRAFVDGARTAARTYFDSYYPQYANLDTQEAKNTWDAFRHTFVSGALAMETNTAYAHFWGDLYEVWTLQLFKEPELSNMDLWNNEIGRTLGETATDSNDLAALVYSAIETNLTINDAGNPNETREYQGQNIVIAPDAIEMLRHIDVLDVLGNIDNFDQSQLPQWSFSDRDFHTLPSWYTNTQTWFGIEITGWWDPLVIDIDGDGLAGDEISARTQMFDLDSDGFATATAWHSDAFLARDLNGNGRIDNGGELFGTATQNGFAALAAHDGNADGVINASDAIWSNLVLWKDINHDGQTQSDEILTLAGQNITGINLAATATGSTGGLTHTGTVTTTTGTLTTGSYVFQQDTANTRYAAEYDFDIRAAFLPNVRGYNELPEFSIALSLDNDANNPDSLMALTQSVVSYSLNGMFENWAAVNTTIENILYRWAGVDGISPTSRGPYIDDARKLEFVEAYLGQGFVDRNEWGTNPGSVQAREFNELWDTQIFPQLKSSILLQTVAGNLFEQGNVAYDFADDRAELTGADLVLSQDTLDILEAAAIALPDTAARKSFWIGVADFLHSFSFLDVDNFTASRAAQEQKLATAIHDSDASLVWATSGHDPANGITSIQYRYFNPLGDTIIGDANANNWNVDSKYFGTPNEDVMIGHGGADNLNGGTGNDIIYGHNEDGSGDDGAADTLDGNGGNDEIYGGGGNDLIFGGPGSDHIMGESGDDNLVETGENNPGPVQNLMEGGIGNDAYHISPSNNTTVAYINDIAGTDNIKFGNYYVPTGNMRINEATFTRSGNSDLRILGWNVSGAISYEITIADQFSDLGNSSGLGVEWVYFDSGTINLKNYLSTYTGVIETVGSAQADTIYGILTGSEDDLIRAGDGNDILYGDEGNDTIYGENGNDEIHGGIGNDFLDGGSGTGAIYGDAGNDTLKGSGGLYGGDGNDTLQAYSGISILDGGAGDDILTVGPGHNTFVASAGNDTIFAANNPAYIDILQFGPGLTVNDLTFERRGPNYNDLVIVHATGTITVTGQFTNPDPFGTTGAIEKIGQVHFYDGSTYLLTEAQSKTVGTSGNDTISGISYGGSINDIIFAGSGNDTVNGGDGNDILHGGVGTDTLNGGNGVDTASYALAAAGVIVDLSLNTASNDGDGGTDTLSSIENATGSAFGDNITGNGSANILDGGAGNDILKGNAGNDTLQGGAGNDQYIFNTGHGQDTITDTDGADDIIKLGPGIVLANLILTNVGNNLEITFTGNATDKITIVGQNAAGTQKVEKLVFDDGSYHSLVNVAPVANDDSTTTNENTAVAISVLANDTDANLDALTVSAVGAAANGTVTINANNTITYTPNTGFYGADSFTYTANDGNGGTDTATVNVTVNPVYNVINGTSANETISGTALKDQINGLGGNDNLNGMGGNDLLYGGMGNDTLRGHGDNDILYGEDGNDYLYGSTGNDYLIGGFGQDIFQGDEGDDILYDLIKADSPVADPTTISDNYDNFYGGSGNDLIIFQAGWDSANGQDGNDTYKIYSYSNVVNRTTLTETSGIDRVILANVNYSDSGWSFGFLAADTSPNEMYFYYQPFTGTASDSYIKINNQFGYDSSGNVLLAIDTFAFADGVVVDFKNTYVTAGTTASETINGTSNRDIILSSHGGDTINGGAGNDYLRGGDGVDTIYGDDGDDIVLGYAGDDTLYGGIGNDKMNGESGNDILYGDDGNDSITDTAGSNQFYGGNGNDSLVGGIGQDIFYGGSGDDYAHGAGGDDIYYYSAGIDTYYDFNGFDSVVITGGTTINDISIANYSGDDAKIVINAGVNEIILGRQRHSNAANHIEKLVFADGFETDQLKGYQNWLWGGNLNDFTTGSNNAEVIIGKDGNDTLGGAGGDDDVHGGAGTDILSGGAGNDFLHGGTGDDALYGGDGLDTIFGGTGADTFVFEPLVAFNNVDIIRDFNVVESDVIDVSDLLTGYDPMTDMIADFVQITDNGTNSFLSVDSDGGANNFVQIATLQAITGLTDEDALESSGRLITV